MGSASVFLLLDPCFSFVWFDFVQMLILWLLNLSTLSFFLLCLFGGRGGEGTCLTTRLPLKRIIKLLLFSWRHVLTFLIHSRVVLN